MVMLFTDSSLREIPFAHFGKLGEASKIGDTMKQKRSWEITDEFWEAAKALIPKKKRDPEKNYKRNPGGGRPPMEPCKVLRQYSTSYAPAYNGKPCRALSALQARYTGILCFGVSKAFSKPCELQGLPTRMKPKASTGLGLAAMAV